jgi:predicted metalloprotease with PDZ domain
MRSRRLVRALLVAAIVAVAPAAVCASERAALEYTIAPDAAAQAFRVRVHVTGADEDAVELRMPSWQPASYAVQPYADAASRVAAVDAAGTALAVTRADASSWRVSSSGRDFTFSYELDLSDRQKLYSKSYASTTAGAVQAGATLVYLPAHRDARIRVALDLPEAWTVATPLAGGPRAFTARDYDELVDSPILFGDLRRADFVVRGVEFSAIYDARLGFDRDELVRSLARFADLEIALFGDAPFARYQFLYLLTPDPSGNGDQSLAVGIEHASSTLITIDPVLAAAPVAFRDVVADTSAHELFHAWNVKAIHPRSLHRPDYAKAPRVRSLWLLEGVTSYYADRIAATAAADSALAEVQLRSSLADDVSQPATGPSLEAIGLEVGTAGLETMLPLYARGAGMGLLLDLEIRTATGDRRSLDDVMRALYARSDRGATPYDEDDLAEAVSHAAGRDMSEFLRRYVAGAEAPPVERILAGVGWRVGRAPVPSGRPEATVRALVSEPDATPLQRRIQARILRVGALENARSAERGPAALRRSPSRLPATAGR